MDDIFLNYLKACELLGHGTILIESLLSCWVTKLNERAVMFSRPVVKLKRW